MPIKLNLQTAALRICVDRYEQEHIEGRILSQRLCAPMSFRDAGDLVILLDQLMDIQRHPEAFQRVRSFSAHPRMRNIPAALEPEEMLPPELVSAEEGRRLTFRLHVTSRMNSSWQGRIDWLDGSPEQHFDSTLDFLRELEARLSSTPD